MKTLAILTLCCILTGAAYTFHHWRDMDRFWIECSTDVECFELHGHEMFKEASHVNTP